MSLIREQFLELEGVLRTVYDLEMKKKKDYIPILFNVDKSNRSQENHFGIGGIGLMQKWTGSVNYDSVEKRWKQEYRHIKYSNGIQIEREALDFKEYKPVKQKTKSLAHSVYLTRQSHCASVFNNAFDTTVAGADGKPLCAASGAGHPYSPTNSSETQVNAGTYDLTPKNIETVRNAMWDFKDDRGNILGVNPRILIVGNYYQKKAKEICGSDKEPYTAENQINIWSDELNYVHCPWILGKKWFLVDPDMMNMYLNWYDARKPKLEYEDDFDTEVGKYKVVGLWSFGWDEWCWVYGNNAA